MKQCLTIVFLYFGLASSSEASTRNIVLTGFWPPTNTMITRFSPKADLNPQGWIGRNWQNSGYDVYAFFPKFREGDKIGYGDFPVDFASTYNDFMKYTGLLHPVALLGFGNGPGYWTIEVNYPAFFQNYFVSGQIPTAINEPLRYPIPESLKREVTYTSSLPVQAIYKQVANSIINADGNPGNFLCGFMAYLEGWYHAEHSNPQAPNYNAMAGFIHTMGNDDYVNQATLKTVSVVIDALQGEM